MNSTMILTIFTLSMQILDIVVGTSEAVYSKSFSSTKMREGLYHKFLTCMVMLIAWLIEVIASAGIDLGSYGLIACDIPSFEIVCVYISVMEIGSIAEIILKAYPELSNNPFFKIFGNSESEVK